MVYTIEESLQDFEAWGGGLNTWRQLTSDQLDELEQHFTAIFGEDEPPTRTDINDYLWYGKEEIAAILGFSSWEELEEENNY